MLDSNHTRANIEAWIDQLPCLLAESETVSELLGKEGLLPSLPGETRARPRRYCRDHETRVGLGYRSSLPALKRDVTWFGVQSVNVSQTGMGFVHSELLYPGERMVLVTRDGVCRDIEIAWCRRLEDRCYAAGAIFAGTIQPNSATVRA